MNSRAIKIAMMVFCSCFIMGCAAAGPQLPIINPQRIELNDAKGVLISKFSELVAKTNRMGFEYATAMCRRIQTGEIQLEGARTSENGRNVAYMFKEKEDAGSANGSYSVIAFSFNPGAELIRMCNQEGLCDVYVKNGTAFFGRTDVGRQGEPAVNNSGIAIKFIGDQSFTYDLLFSYRNLHKREGDELISIFLSAFPTLYYQ